MVTLVCLDRDGTINTDDNNYLGSSPEWKEQVRIIDGVSEGIRKLNELPHTEVFIVTNQSGVAVNEPFLAELTESRMHEVNQYVIEVLAREGAHIRGYFACPFVDARYVRKAQERGWKLHPGYVVDNHPDWKPNIGMLEKCAITMGVHLHESRLFTVGDRASDVELGLNGGGTGILVAGKKTHELKDAEKVRNLREAYGDRVYIAQDFLDAVTYIQNHTTPW